MADFISDAEMAKLSAKQPGFVSDADMDKLQKEEQEFSSTGETVKAGAEGLLRGATLGLSDWAETKLGISTPERVAKRKEYNPVASTGGEIVGTIGSTLLAPGASLPGLVERAGVQVAERATARLAAQSVGKKVAQRAISDAVQGAAYGAGSLISEQALGNSDLTAEQIMGTVGVGTLLGGTIGAGFAGAGVAAKKTLAATKIPDALYKALGGKFSRVAGAVSDKNPQELEKLWNNIEKAAISDEERTAMQDAFVDHMAKQHAAIQQFQVQTQAQRPAQLASVLEQEFGKEATETQVASIRNFIEDAKSAIGTARQEPELFGGTSKIRRLEMMVGGLEENWEHYASHPGSLYNYMDDMKRRLDDIGEWKRSLMAIPSADRETVQLLRGVRDSLKKNLEDKSVWGTAAQRQTEYNKAISKFIAARDWFEKKFTDKMGAERNISNKRFHPYLYNLGQGTNTQLEDYVQKYINHANDYARAAEQVHLDVGSSVSAPNLSLPQDVMTTLEANNLLRRLKSPYRNTGAKENLASPQAIFNMGLSGMTGHPLAGAAAALMNILANPVSTMEKFQAIGQVKQRAVKHFDMAIDLVIQGKAPEYATIGAVDLATQPDLLKDKRGDDSADVFVQRVTEIQELAQNPDLLTDRLAQTTRGIEGLSDIQAQLSGKLGNGVQYLASTAPKDPTAGSLTRKKWQPKPTDIMQWNRRLAAVQNPYSVLANPTKEGLEALRTVYPEIYQFMAQRVYERIAGKDNTEVPYRAKLKLSKLFDLNLDRSGNAADVARFQASYAQQQEQQAPSRGGRPMASISQAQTGTERIESR